MNTDESMKEEPDEDGKDELMTEAVVKDEGKLHLKSSHCLESKSGCGGTPPDQIWQCHRSKSNLAGTRSSPNSSELCSQKTCSQISHHKEASPAPVL